MHKARKELHRLASSVQVCVEVLDARAPGATANPELQEIFRTQPIIRILSKSDLADSAATTAWLSYLMSSSGYPCLLNSKADPLQRQTLVDAASKVAPSTSFDAGTANKLVIVGIPNVGKSTLLNQLTGRNLAKTANEPAITRGQQRVKLTADWFLIDTPGLMWPRLEDQQGANLMAMLGCIRNTAIDTEAVAWFAADYLMQRFPAALLTRYPSLDNGADAEAVLLAVARTRGALSKGGKVDWHRAAELLLNDLRSGKLGRLSLETAPE